MRKHNIFMKLGAGYKRDVFKQGIMFYIKKMNRPLPIIARPVFSRISGVNL